MIERELLAMGVAEGEGESRGFRVSLSQRRRSVWEAANRAGVSGANQGVLAGLALSSAAL